MSNHLKGESSPYLLQHAENPVNWYPWGDEAFDRAVKEDKPVFLSIGYSTCHWCHVMAHESFENEEIAALLNHEFISVKVDREERPDIDSVYMSVCQAFTGRGGWPMSIFMTADQKPFFAGTYYPPDSRQGMIGFRQLLQTVAQRWRQNREALLSTAEQICTALNQSENEGEKDEWQALQADVGSGLWKGAVDDGVGNTVYQELVERAVDEFKERFDPAWGGFGAAPKFPTAHNLLFLLLYWKYKEKKETEIVVLNMVERTLDAMRRGGIFDQIGYGFSRYSTDQYFLVPHFEKMLYDNALLMMAYAAAYHLTGKNGYLDTAEKTAEYLLREMHDPAGGFYSAQDADSDGEEGKFYLWEEEEICSVLGKERGMEFCRYYGMNREGNFEGKNIPNLLNGNALSDDFEEERQKLYSYRKNRGVLHLDDKILTSWNALAICGMVMLYRVSGKEKYLSVAENAAAYIEEHLAEGVQLYVGCRNQKLLVKGFLDEYAFYTAALIFLYDATAEESYLNRAIEICEEVQEQFADRQGGYFLYGGKNGTLIARPKETYDGAIPSGNSVMLYCLSKLAGITGKELYVRRLERQMVWMHEAAKEYPSGHCLYLMVLLLQALPQEKITVVLGENDCPGEVIRKLSVLSSVQMFDCETAEYQKMEGKTTYYVCRGHVCLPPKIY